MKSVILLVGILAVARSVPLVQESDTSAARLLADNFANCVNSDLSLCLKEQALKVAERLHSVRSLKIIDGVTFINGGNLKEGRSLEQLSEDPATRKKQVSQRLWDSTSDLLQNSELEISYSGSDDAESRALSDDVNDVEEGRGKKKQVKKKIKMLLPLAIIAKIKGIILAVAFLGIIALSVFKIAAIAKLLFLAKAATALKHLLSKKHDDDDHGWHTVQVHHDDHAHGHGGGGGYDANAQWNSGWSRSRTEGQNLAYAAYRK